MSSRALTTNQVCEKLGYSRRRFFDLRKTGRLPMVQEIKPRDDVARYLEQVEKLSRSQ